MGQISTDENNAPYPILSGSAMAIVGCRFFV
jgi:hypothetical protein